MRSTHSVPYVLAGLIAGLTIQGFDGPVSAQVPPDVRALYERSASFGNRTNNLIYNLVSDQAWVQGSSDLTYRKSVKGGNEFVLVNPTTKAKSAPFDHARLAASMSTANSAKYTAVTLPFTTFTFVNNRQAIEFAIGGAAGGGRAGGGGGGGVGRGGAPTGPPAPRWRCTLSDYTCTRVIEAPDAQAGQGRGGRQGGGRGGPGGAGAGRCAPVLGPAGPGPAAPAVPQVCASFDGKQEALIQNYNVFVRPVGGNANAGAMLSTDGSEGNAYRFEGLAWSADSKKLAAVRRRPGYERLVHYVDSSPSDQLQPKHTTMSYRKPGDVVDFDVPVIFDVASKKQVQADLALMPNPYAVTQVAWRTDGRAVTFEYNQRGHQVYRVLELDATTGRTRTLVEETSKTFIEYSGKRYRNDPADGKEIIWRSERDGWSHLYLYDGVTGQVKNQITKGNWVIRGVDRVDEPTRQIWFSASGMYDGKDPYLVHYYRINFDGTGLVSLGAEDGNHSAPQYSSDRQFYVDSWSRVDLPPQTVLKRTSDQSVVMDLEKADITDLLATGWRMPEVVTSKARDGKTDIWGIVIRPTNFDANRKYPVIENIYAGPQGSFVPKTFSTQGGMNGLAEFGFIVVQVDGLGTSNRSKAFHDVAWQNLGDAGFPDRIIWHKAVAAKYPNNYDLTRVGIYGTSAGGQNSAGALLFHPDFYHVAYSNSGCHDNRMDKIWWNEQWMGWPIGPHYGASSNVDNASKLQGKLMLLVPELDTNVDPSSTMQVVDALIRANKTFELVVVPGANHGAGGAFSTRKRNDWFVKNLLGIDPPNWNVVALPAASGNGDFDEPDYFELERAPFFPEGAR